MSIREVSFTREELKICVVLAAMHDPKRAKRGPVRDLIEKCRMAQPVGGELVQLMVDS